MDRLILEIAVFNLHSALTAAEAGADRLELCENPSEGGTTPSYGTLKTLREKITTPVFPIIRPRGGDFLYSEEEFSAMEKDILLCRELQFEGVVSGALNADGTINTRQTRRMVELAYPMEFSFHRAFDRVSDPMTSLNQLINCGCTRILTSGQHPQAWEGRELIKELVIAAGGRIIIMPGSGVRSDNIIELAVSTQAIELHSSARMLSPSGMNYHKTSMNEDLTSTCVNKNEVQRMRYLLDNYRPEIRNEVSGIPAKA